MLRCRRHFYIASEANGSVLGVERGGLKPGTHLVLELRRPDRAFHQIWYLDLEGIIRSKLNDFAFESTSRQRLFFFSFVCILLLQ